MMNDEKKINSSEAKKLKQYQMVAVVILPFLLTIAIDQMSKYFAYTGRLSQFNSEYLNLNSVQNHGMMGSLFVDLPLGMRILSLSIWGSLNVFVAFLIQYFLSGKSLKLAVSIGLVSGGITGNLLDRILKGYVVDFVHILKPIHIVAIFNIADVLQIVGYVLITYFLLKDWQKIFPENSLRNQLWILPDFQKSYLSNVYVLLFGFSLIIGAFFFGFLTLIVSELSVPDSTKSHYMLVFLISFSFILVSFLITATWLSLVISHRIAGPVYAVQRLIKDLISGKSPKFKLREKDQFKEFESLANQLTESFRALKQKDEK